MSRDCILILDFGSQYTQLIARRIREHGVYCEIHPPEFSAEQVRNRAPAGVILSGGPDSVYDESAARLDTGVLDAGSPVLGICYGMQLMVRELGGSVEAAARREYGPAVVEVHPESIFRGLDPRQEVWMSHGDRVTRLPDGFRSLAGSENARHAAMEDASRRLLGVQFHPEVAHTVHGSSILRNFLFDVCGCAGDWTMENFLEEQVERIRESVGDGRVLAGLSGGVDSTVMASLVHRAVGDRLTCVFVDTGLLRKAEGDQVMRDFAERYHIRVRRRDAESLFLDRLDGVEDPEEKRRRIGETFVRVFEEEASAVGDATWLGQGTLYPDVIESHAVGGPSHTIKTHHNVGGLPERMKLKVLEPLRMLFKDEVRRLGAALGLDRQLIDRHPFPGPGLAVRILGEVTRERCEVLREADWVFLEELRAGGWYHRCSQAFAVLLPVRTVGVMGDLRTYENVIALRAVTTGDFMTADWTRLPHELLARASSRVVNEVHGVNRVVYDVTSKPPGTIEWE